MKRNDVLKGILNEQKDILRGVYQTLATHKALFLYSVLFDLVYLFITGLVNVTLVRKLAGVMYLIGGQLSKASLGVTTSTGIMELLRQANASSAIAQFTILFLLWIGGLYFLYCFFQTLCWRLAYRMNGKDVPLLPFAKRFFRLNIPVYGVFILLNALLFVSAYVSTSRANTGNVSVHPLWYAPYFVLLYIALVAYGSMGRQTVKVSVHAACREGWQQKRQLIPSFVMILLLFAIIEVVMLGAGFLHRILLVLTGFFLFIPAFTVVRLYWLMQFNRIFLKNKGTRLSKEG